MTTIAQSENYSRIEDRLDTVGRKYRAQRILRGSMLCVAAGIVSSLAAGLAAHFTRESYWTYLILAIWAAGMATSIVLWFGRPVLVRPDPMVLARFVESRVDGLHNSLTNALLLARRPDIAASPWLPAIYQEIVGVTTGKPLASAVRMADLRRPAVTLAVTLIPGLLLFAIVPRPFIHGWRQLFHPGSFVPTIGAARILDVEPEDVILVAGQPLEVSFTAECAGEPKARLLFERATSNAGQPDGPAPDNAELSPAHANEMSSNPAMATVQYSYRLDHVDASVRYRVEVAGTQSRWYAVTAVRQVKLTELFVHITPPPYTRLGENSVSLRAENLGKTAFVVAQGSRVDLRATIDVPVGGAMLQTADAAPLPMRAAPGPRGRQFEGSITVTDDTPVAILLTQGAGQVIAKVPDDPLVIRCTHDAPPAIEMKWPTQDAIVPLNAELKIRALLRDDYGVASARLLASNGADTASGKLAVAYERHFGAAAGVRSPQEFSFVLSVDPSIRKHAGSIKVQVQATDNRQLPGQQDSGPQTTASPIFEIRFQDPGEIAREQIEHSQSLREKLREMLRMEEDLHDRTRLLDTANPAAFDLVADGQRNLRDMMRQTAAMFPFAPSELRVQKALLMICVNEATDAADLAASLPSEPSPLQRVKLHVALQFRQQQIINLLLALLQGSEPATQPADQGADMLSAADQYKKLDETLKKYIPQQQQLLSQAAGLAKKPVDNWDVNDKKLSDDLKQAQNDLEKFLQQAVSGFSKLAEQDMANSSSLEQLLEIYSEVTMAKNALKHKAMEIAVASEDSGVEMAKELQSNIEKWLADNPDRTKWRMEDPLVKADVPMPELPRELEDMIGKLLEQEEDLFDQLEDQDANRAGSFDKGIGWEAVDGPIADVSAKGVTGNQLPKNADMNGRSGEGRTGRSQGEFAEDHASGKGGRRTPTRLDSTPFQRGQVKDTSNQPAGGATGGGKVSGQGADGLEGPVPFQSREQMTRLAQRQAEIRNSAERLHLQYQLGRYDNFKLLDSIALMRRVESDLKANRYWNALRRRDLLLDELDASRMLLGSQIHVQRDTSPSIDRKTRQEINDAMKGELPPAWSEALKEYYKKLSQQ